MDELAKRIADLADKVSQPALDAARGAVRIEAFSSMTSSILWAAAAYGLYKGGQYLRAKEDSNDSDIANGFGFALLVIAGGISLLVIWTFVDPWIWTAINNPDLYLAKRILKL